MNLNQAGADLFNDPEIFIKDLNEESEQVIGGNSIPIYFLQPTCVKTHGHCLDQTAIGVIHR